MLQSVGVEENAFTNPGKAVKVDFPRKPDNINNHFLEPTCNNPNL